MSGRLEQLHVASLPIRAHGALVLVHQVAHLDVAQHLDLDHARVLQLERRALCQQSLELLEALAVCDGHRLLGRPGQLHLEVHLVVLAEAEALLQVLPCCIAKRPAIVEEGHPRACEEPRVFAVLLVRVDMLGI